MTSIHVIRCKKTGEPIGAKLDGGWCACQKLEGCRLEPAPAYDTLAEREMDTGTSLERLVDEYRED